MNSVNCLEKPQCPDSKWEIFTIRNLHYKRTIFFYVKDNKITAWKLCYIATAVLRRTEKILSVYVRAGSDGCDVYASGKTTEKSC